MKKAAMRKRRSCHGKGHPATRTFPKKRTLFGKPITKRKKEELEKAGIDWTEEDEKEWKERQKEIKRILKKKEAGKKLTEKETQTLATYKLAHKITLMNFALLIGSKISQELNLGEINRE